MRISDWSSDVCSSDLTAFRALEPYRHAIVLLRHAGGGRQGEGLLPLAFAVEGHIEGVERAAGADRGALQGHAVPAQGRRRDVDAARLAEAGVLALDRSEGRRVGKECVGTGRS